MDASMQHEIARLTSENLVHTNIIKSPFYMHIFYGPNIVFNYQFLLGFARTNG